MSADGTRLRVVGATIPDGPLPSLTPEGWAQMERVLRANAHALPPGISYRRQAQFLADVPPFDRWTASQLCAGLMRHRGEDYAPPLAGETPRSAPGDLTPIIDAARLQKGGGFIFDQPEGVPAVWGSGDDVLWSAGEALWLVGPPGVGKTTVVGQLVRGRLGLTDHAIAWPIKAGAKSTLYLAMDRPAQIARALRRHFTTEERQTLDDRLVIWRGPPPADVAKQPGILLELARQAGADTLVVDSVKDAAIGLSDDETGAAVNRAIQAVTVEGIEVACLHHQRKGQGGEKPKTLQDVYGSTWLTAGAGSVLLLWGKAGDLVVELHHLKQPATEVGPLKLSHDHAAGITTITGGWDPLAWLQGRGSQGGTATDAARQMFEKSAPTDNERRKAQRRLDALVDRTLATRIDPVLGGSDGTQAARYKVAPIIEEMTP